MCFFQTTIHVLYLLDIQVKQNKRRKKKINNFIHWHRQVKSSQTNISNSSWSNYILVLRYLWFLWQEIDSLKLHMNSYRVNLLMVVILCIPYILDKSESLLSNTFQLQPLWLLCNNFLSTKCSYTNCAHILRCLYCYLGSKFVNKHYR